MTEPTLTDAERETVEACAKAIWQSWHPGKEMSPSDLMAHHETEAEAEAALRALNPGARLPGGLVVVRAEDATLAAWWLREAAKMIGGHWFKGARGNVMRKIADDLERMAPQSAGNGG